MSSPDQPVTVDALADALRERIATGTYAPATRLPGRAALVAEFGATDRTVARALARLRSDGSVYVVDGGWYVRADRPVIRSSRTRLSRAERDAERGTFTTDCAAAGLVPHVDTTVDVVPADLEVAGLLDLEPGANVLVRDRVMRGGDEVLQLTTSYLPRALTRGTWVEDENSGPGGIYRRLEELGYELTGFTERLAVGRATEHEGRMFSLTPGDPVLRITRVAHSHDRAVEVNRITLTPDRYELLYELPAT